MTGAEIYGTSNEFDRNRDDCDDWMMDHDYLLLYDIDDDEAHAYVDNVRRDGKICEHCFWFDGDYCTNPKVDHDQDIGGYVT